MAILERGKGKRKQSIEIARHGAVLRMQEIEAGDKRLPGYRRCADDAAAAGGLTAEVHALLDGGMVPADDEARAIAAARPVKASGPPVLPIRADLAIYNEATGFVVTSRKMAGKTLDEGSPEWKKAVTRGQMLPVTLVQDDPFNIRIVAGAPLTPEEEREWVARIDWQLAVPDGKLCVTGGAEFTNEGYDPDDPGHERFVGELAIPKGTYRASLYCCAHGVNGELRPEEPDGEIIDFVLHLDPVDAAPKSDLSALPDTGWFSGEENARKPGPHPAPLKAVDLIRRSDEPTGEWTFVRDVFEMMPDVTRAPVKGDAATLPLDSLGHAARIAWFASRFVVFELRLTAAAGGALDLSGEWPEGVVAVQEGGTGRVLFDNDLDFDTTNAVLRAAAPHLAKLPDGTVLDLCSVALESMPGAPRDAGLLSIRGLIRDGGWRIAQAFPEVDAATLRAALALAAEIDTGTSIAVRDQAEGEAIMAWAKRNFGHHLKSNPPKLGNGAIRVKSRGPEVAMLGIAAFAHRFASTWKVTDLSPLEEEDDDSEDGMFPAKPIKGAEVFAAPSGRIYYQTMALLVSQKLGEEIPKRERPLRGAGFKQAGDVMCSAMENVAFHGYVRPGGHAWAYFRLASPFEIAFEIATVFADGSVIVTRASAGDDLNAVMEQHDRRVAEQSATLGAPRTVEPRLQSLAETLEAVILRAS